MSLLSISTPTVIINNISYGIVPNSFSFTEGFGEQTVRAQSAGGGSVAQVYSDNAEMKFSTVKFSMFNINLNIERIREWKANRNENVIEVIDSTSNFARTFKAAALTSDYEVSLSADGTIDLEWKSAPAQ